MKRLICLFLPLLLLLALVLPAYAAKTEAIADGILAVELKSAGIDTVTGYLTEILPQRIGGTAEWYALALTARGEAEENFAAYRTALSAALAAGDRLPAATKQKYALALAAVGGTDAAITRAADEIGKSGTMSVVFALHLAANGYGTKSAAEVTDLLLSLQQPDGGFAAVGTASGVDATAMALAALADVRGNEATETAILRGVDFLSARMSAAGDFSDFGVPNAESTAQVILALSALGIDCMTDARFCREGKTPLDGIENYRLSDGTFAHTAGGGTNELATAEVFCAFVARERMLRGATPFYLLDHAHPAETETPVVGGETPDENGGNTANAAKWYEKYGYKPFAAAGVLLVAAAVAVILLLRGRRNPKNFIVLALAAALCVTLVCVTDIRSPETYYGEEATPRGETVGSVSLSVRCDSVAGAAPHLPADGVMLETAVEITADDTALSVLIEAARKAEVPMEFSGTKNAAYVQGIGNLYEADYGSLSGWTYLVNGVSPSVGAGEYRLADGDCVEWRYTLDYSLTK